MGESTNILSPERSFSYIVPCDLDHEYGRSPQLIWTLSESNGWSILALDRSHEYAALPDLQGFL